MNKFVTIIVVVCATIAVTAGNREEFNAIRTQCQQQVGATDAEAAELKPGSTPTSQKAKCMLACIQKQKGWMDANSKFSASAAIASLPQELKQNKPDKYAKISATFTACDGTGGGNQCDAAVLIEQCLHQNGFGGQHSN